MNMIENLMSEYTQKLRALVVAEVQRNVIDFAGVLANFDAAARNNVIVRRKPGRPVGSKNGSGAHVAKNDVSAPTAPVSAKKSQPQTPALLAARKLQGRYLGSLKRLAGKQREQVKAMAKKNGVADAVKLAAKFLGEK